MQEGGWYFQCPHCVIGSGELERIAEDQELLCEICLEEGRGEVRLLRWLPETTPAAQARLRPDLAA